MSSTRPAGYHWSCRSTLGDATSQRAHHSLTQPAGAAPFTARLGVRLRALVHGHRYLVAVHALDADGDASELRLPAHY